MPVNGRNATLPEDQVKSVLRSKVVGEERGAAIAHWPLPVQRMIWKTSTEKVPRSGLARRLGRTRATVLSAVKVLRHGAFCEDRIELMAHIDLKFTHVSTVDYEFVDERHCFSEEAHLRNLSLERHLLHSLQRPLAMPSHHVLRSTH